MLTADQWQMVTGRYELARLDWRATASEAGAPRPLSESEAGP